MREFPEIFIPLGIISIILFLLIIFKIYSIVKNIINKIKKKDKLKEKLYLNAITSQLPKSMYWIKYFDSLLKIFRYLFLFGPFVFNIFIAPWISYFFIK